MRRAFALPAKIVDGANDAFAHQVHPDAIDENAIHQGLSGSVSQSANSNRPLPVGL